ncbi:hypothetical protein AQJ66_11320 [Streptomyces bungoensis]|uniref:Uncharacterized protein n=1 Tax=Streptomyces bungoensis TaxID=285568 RepID=A0A101T6I9_9ACTN|nr:hypothetical protein AQJ66_11320 [Streptomyces bungoensis]
MDRSCCSIWGIAISPKTSAMSGTSPTRARCARLNLDSQDMDRGLPSVSGLLRAADAAADAQMGARRTP